MHTPPADSLSSDFRLRLMVGLVQLLQAGDHALRSGHSLWHCPVSIAELQVNGLTEFELCWLTRHGLVEHRRKTTSPAQPRLSRAHARRVRRSFRPALAGHITPHSCFTITSDGRAYADALRQLVLAPKANGRETPEWRPEDHILLWRGDIVIKFEEPARNPETLIAIIQENLWERRTPSPFSSARQLIETVRSLNRRRQRKTLEFHSEKKGKYVLWDPL